MDLSTQLFENAPVGIDGVLGQICQIFVTHWKPLVMITGLQLVAFIGASIVLGGFTFAFISAFAVLGGFDFLVSAKYSVAIIAIVQIMSNNTRHLLDYSVGISGASRFLRELILSIENLSIFGQYPKTTRQTLNIYPNDHFPITRNTVAKLT